MTKLDSSIVHAAAADTIKCAISLRDGRGHRLRKRGGNRAVVQRHKEPSFLVDP